MSDNNIEPQPVIDVVERYVERELRDLAQYTNREPFDESGVWSLQSKPIESSTHKGESSRA